MEKSDDVMMQIGWAMVMQGRGQYEQVVCGGHSGSVRHWGRRLKSGMGWNDPMGPCTVPLQRCISGGAL